MLRVVLAKHVALFIQQNRNTLHIQVNGEQQEVRKDIPLTDLVSQLKLRSEQIAIELNGRVIRRSAWADTVLHPGDRLEIVHFVGGG